MSKLTPAEAAAKWATNLKGQAGQMRASVEKITVSPGAQAAKVASDWASKMSDPEIHRKWARNVGSVDVNEWKSAYIEKGIPNLARGVEKAQGKMGQFLDNLFSYQDANVGKVRSLPKLTKEDSRRRMNDWFDIMSEYRYK